MGLRPLLLALSSSGEGDDAYLSSLSPHGFVKNVAKDAKIFAITGSRDKNTRPALAKGYISDLKKHGVDARYIEAPGIGHAGPENAGRQPESIFPISDTEKCRDCGSKLVASCLRDHMPAPLKFYKPGVRYAFGYLATVPRRH